MSYIRNRLIGEDVTFSDTSFIFPTLVDNIDLATYATRGHMETNPMHIVLVWNVVNEAEATGASIFQHYTVFYDPDYYGGNYAYYGISYSTDCPVYSESFGDGVFEWSNEGSYLVFTDDIMQIGTSVRSPNGITLRIRAYAELYINSDVA